jgi:1-acyl-sn-glycerol-3-phosphate acyltransferase
VTGTAPRADRAARRAPRSAATGAIVLRSVLFNAAFYLTLVLYLVVALLALPFPRHAMLGVAKAWGRTNLWLLRAICGIEVEWRGLEKIPRGPLIVASKHQSVWETFALIPLFADPTFIVKRELMWIPVFGWCMWRADMISVDRGAGSQAMFQMTERAKFEIGRGRQIIIFPEGTRRGAGAAPAYKFGVAKLYAATGAPCLPIALNSGLVWPRRSFLRYPGVVRVEILDPIPPRLAPDAFFTKLQREIETATARLLEEGR